MIYVHQHRRAASESGVVKNTSHTTVREKCSLCDAMHHNFTVIAIVSDIHSAPVLGHVFKNVVYNFKGVQRIASSGRAPPAGIYSV